MKVRNFVILIIFAILMSTTIVYAYNNDLIKINEAKASVFDITYNNVRKINKDGSIDTSNSDINLDTELTKPGDYTEFAVDITNNSNKDAVIDSIVKDGLTEQQQKYLDYSIKYLDGNDVKIGDVFKAGEVKTAKVRIEYLNDISPSDLPTNDEQIKYSFNIIMVEK